MTWLDKLERRFGFLGIPGLIRIVIGFTALVWALMWLNPNFRFALNLDPGRIRHGEVWRLLTYAFLHSGDIMHILFNMLALWWFGRAVEDILLLNFYPWKISPLTRELVADAAEFFFFQEETFAGRQPFLVRNDPVFLRAFECF